MVISDPPQQATEVAPRSDGAHDVEVADYDTVVTAATAIAADADDETAAGHATVRQTRGHPSSAAPVNVSHVSAETVGDIATEAAAMATAVGKAASATAAKARHTLSQIAALDGSSDGGHKANALDLEGLRAELAHGLDEAVRTEFAVFLADPVMHRFSADLGPETVVSSASPAEQGLWRDISLARRMEAALRGREAHFEAAFHSAPTAMLILSLVDGHPDHFLHVNRAFSRLTGYPQSSLLDFGFADLAHPHHAALQEEPVSSERGGTMPPGLQVQRWMHADGSDLWVRIHAAELRYSGYGTKQSVCQIEDVTAQTRTDATPPAPPDLDEATQAAEVPAQDRRDSSLGERGTSNRQADLRAPGPRQPWDQ